MERIFYRHPQCLYTTSLLSRCALTSFFFLFAPHLVSCRQVIFSEIEVILQLNTLFLSQLEEKLPTWDSEHTKIGDVFLGIVRRKNLPTLTLVDTLFLSFSIALSLLSFSLAMPPSLNLAPFLSISLSSPSLFPSLSLR